MRDQPDPTPEEASASEPAVETSEASGNGKRRGKTLGFLGSWTFWWRLGVGILILGTGVLIGLGIERLADDDRRSGDYRSGGGDAIILEIEPSGEWYGEGRLSKDGKRFRFIPMPGKGSGWGGDERGWKGKEWSGQKEWSKGELGEGKGIYIPYELLEEAIERIGHRIERVLERVENHLEEGRFPPGMMWPDRFDNGKGDWGFGREHWKEKEFPRERDYLPDEPEQKDRYERPADGEGEESWGRIGESPFEGFGFPFGELFSSFGFPQDCEVDLERLPDVLDNLPDLEEESELQDNENSEDFESFFEQIEALLEEICETPDQ